MKIIVTDDEPRALKDTLDAVTEVVPNCDAATFSSAASALAYAVSNHIDVAFLDIELGRTNGLVLAKKLKDLQPHIHIIFVTSYDKYAVDAFAIHATGYLLKPVYPPDIRRELTFLYGENVITDGKRIRVHTFGGFDVYVNGEKLYFKRSKSKELLAYLVDRRGASVTVREVCAVLFEDGKYDVARKNYFQTIVSELQSVLKNAGAEVMLSRKHNSLAVDTTTFTCDSYRFLEGDPIAINNYRRDYMLCYSWAEFTMGIMEAEI